MNGETLATDDLAALASTHRFHRRFSLESRNQTPTPSVASAAMQFVTWPIKVTGSAVTVDPVTGEPSGSGDAVSMYPGVWLKPNEFATGFVEMDDVWLLPLPGSTFGTGDVALARLGGRNSSDGLAVYVADKSAPGAAGGGDVWGPDCAYTGAVTLFTDPNGRFIGASPVLGYSDRRLGVSVNQRFFYFQADSFPIENHIVKGITTSPYIAMATTTGPPGTFSSVASYDEESATSALYQIFRSGRGAEQVLEAVHIKPDGAIAGHIKQYAFFSSGVSGQVETFASGGAVVQKVSAMQIHQAHYTEDGTQGLTAGSFKQGVFTSRAASISTLSGGASLSDVITKVNEIIARLQSSGLTN